MWEQLAEVNHGHIWSGTLLTPHLKWDAAQGTSGIRHCSGHIWNGTMHRPHLEWDNSQATGTWCIALRQGKDVELAIPTYIMYGGNAWGPHR